MPIDIEGYYSSGVISLTKTHERDSTITLTIDTPDQNVVAGPGRLGGVCMNSNGIDNVTITIYDNPSQPTPETPHGKELYRRSWNVTYQRSDMDWFGNKPIFFHYGCFVDIDGTGGECIIYTNTDK